MSKLKRAREPSTVNTTLVEIYEDLAHEDEDVRIKAALKLLTTHFRSASQDEVRAVIKRLFRGLCSSRKAARLGFGTALTECLIALPGHDHAISGTEVVDLLEKNTVSEMDASGQEERDHYFGRLFGSDAIIKSKLLFNNAEFSQWQRLLDLICEVSTKKPWLRQECGWVLYTGVIASGSNPKLQRPLLEILEKLNQHKLIRTPEGLALWIKVQETYPAASRPAGVWKHGDPLARQDLQALAQILKDSRATSKDSADFEAQGSARWSHQLHFAWDVVLAQFLEQPNDGQRVPFSQFWQTAVDQGLMSAVESQERKHWGILLLSRIAPTAPVDALEAALQGNTLNCLMQALRSKDRYLKKGAELALRALQRRAETSPRDAASVIGVLLRAVNVVDFDIVTKTKTMEKIASAGTSESQIAVISVLCELFREPAAADQGDAATRRRNILNIQSRQLASTVSRAVEQAETGDLRAIKFTLNYWIDVLCNTQKIGDLTHPLSDATKSQVQEKLSSGFGEALKLGNDGRQLVLKCIASLEGSVLSADSQILEVLQEGWQRFRRHNHAEVNDRPKAGISSGKHKILSKGKGGRSAPEEHAASASGIAGGLALLYGLVIFQIYTGDAEAVSILEELIAFEKESLSLTDAKSKTPTTSNADGLVEILLSFASRQSKFLRRVTLDIFEAFTSQISIDGLTLLTDVLDTQESKAGQAELFEEGPVDVDGESSASGSDDSDVDMLDSDVEIVSAQEEAESTSDGSFSESDSDSVSGGESGDDSEDPDGASGELEALEKALASTLGTHKLKPADALDAASSKSEDSDSDMTDSEMLELDDKLADVFRARAAAMTTNQQKKKDSKSAKENITHFKNRVLDMIDIYLRQECQNANALASIVPLLRLIRKTSVAQLRVRAADILRSLCNNCKGPGKLPVLSTTEEDTTRAMNILQETHDEVCLPSPNTHKNACSQSSILLVKTLLNAGVDVESCVRIYAATQLRMLVDLQATVQPQFFNDWSSWCGDVRGKLGKEQTNGHAGSKQKRAKKRKSRHQAA